MKCQNIKDEKEEKNEKEDKEEKVEKVDQRCIDYEQDSNDGFDANHLYWKGT